MTLSFTRRSLRSLATCALAAVAASSSPLAALEPEAVAPPQILPVDPTSCGHFWPAAALGPDGRALTAWATPGVGLRGRVLGASGIASGPEIALAPGGTSVPSLAAAPSGWVAAWVRGTGTSSELVLQKLDRDAGAAGPVVPVTAEPLFVYPPPSRWRRTAPW